MSEDKTILGIDAAMFANLVAESLEHKKIGRGLSEAVAKAFESYNVKSSIEDVLRQQVRDAAAEIIQERYAGAIRAAVEKELTEEIIQSAAAKSVDKLKRQLDDAY